jgi:hypothetical protein
MFSCYLDCLYHTCKLTRMNGIRRTGRRATYKGIVSQSRFCLICDYTLLCEPNVCSSHQRRTRRRKRHRRVLIVLMEGPFAC